MNLLYQPFVGEMHTYIGFMAMWVMFSCITYFDKWEAMKLTTVVKMIIAFDLVSYFLGSFNILIFPPFEAIMKALQYGFTLSVFTNISVLGGYFTGRIAKKVSHLVIRRHI